MKRLNYKWILVDVVDEKDTEFYEETMGFVILNMNDISSIAEYVERYEEAKILEADSDVVIYTMNIEDDERPYPISAIFTLANGEVLYHAKTLHTSCFYFNGGKSVLFVD